MKRLMKKLQAQLDVTAQTETAKTKEDFHPL